MPMGNFTAALVGSVPTAFAFAAIGAWADQPIWLSMSYALPILLLPIALLLMRRPS